MIKYYSVKQFFEANNLDFCEESVKDIIKDSTDKAMNLIRKRTAKIKSFIQHDFSFLKPKIINVKKFIKQVSQEQQRIKMMQARRFQNSLSKIQKEHEIFIQEQAKLKELKDSEYKKQLDSLALLKEKRNLALRQAKSELRGVKKEKRLYQKLEDQFHSDYILPENEARKEILKQRKKNFFPIKLEEIVRHSKNFFKNLKEKTALKTHQRSLTKEQIFITPLMKIIKKRETEEKQRQKSLEFEKKKRLERRNTYAKLSQELYQPRIDFLKRKELEIIKEKIALPVKRKIYSSKAVKRSKSVYMS